MCLLADNPGQVFTRNRIINHIQDEEYIVTERTIDVHMLSLRKKLGQYSNLIQTIRGIGYKMVEK